MVVNELSRTSLPHTRKALRNVLGNMHNRAYRINVDNFLLYTPAITIELRTSGLPDTLANRVQLLVKQIEPVINQMRPSGEPSLHCPRWREYLVLQQRYSHNQDRHLIAKQLCIDLNTYNHVLARALDKLWILLQPLLLSNVDTDIAPPYLPTHATQDAYVKLLLKPCRLAFYGLPGVGKSTFMSNLTQHPNIIQHYEQRIVYLHAGQHNSTSCLLKQLGEKIGIVISDIDHLPISTYLQRLQLALSKQSWLIFIDDVWDIATAQSLFVASHCAYAISTRSSRIAHEFAHDQAYAISTLGQSESERALTHYVPCLAVNYAPVLRQLAYQLRGCPLALTIVGRHLRCQAQLGPPRRLNTAIQALLQPYAYLYLSNAINIHDYASSDTQMLKTGRVSLADAIEQSLKRLSQNAQRILLSLAQLAPQPSPYAEADVLALHTEAHTIIQAGLDELVDAGLLDVTKEGKYHCHPIIMDYVLSKSA